MKTTVISKNSSPLVTVRWVTLYLKPVFASKEHTIKGTCGGQGFLTTFFVVCCFPSLFTFSFLLSSLHSSSHLFRRTYPCFLIFPFTHIATYTPNENFHLKEKKKEKWRQHPFLRPLTKSATGLPSPHQLTGARTITPFPTTSPSKQSTHPLQPAFLIHTISHHLEILIHSLFCHENARFLIFRLLFREKTLLNPLPFSFPLFPFPFILLSIN